MVKTTYHIAPYLGAFGAYLMPLLPINGSKGVSIYKNDCWNVIVKSCYLPLVLVKTTPTDYIVQNLTIQLNIQAYLMPQGPKYGSKGVSLYKNNRWNVAVNSCYLPSGQKAISFGQKQPQQTIWLRKLTIYLNIQPLLGPISCPRDPNRVQKMFP